MDMPYRVERSLARSDVSYSSVTLSQWDIYLTGGGKVATVYEVGRASCRERV